MTVYCRSHHITYKGRYYKGMRLIKLPTIGNKYLDTIVHSLLSSAHALTEHYDIALYFIAGNSPVTWIPRLAGTKTILNVDGLDWKRAKWPPVAKAYIKVAERLATVLPTTYLTDSRVVQTYYQRRFSSVPRYIAYGSDIEAVPAGRYLRQFGLVSRGYVLYVGRLVPENCAHDLVEAFAGLNTDKLCVIVGDAPYAKSYIARLRAGSPPNIIFTGYLFNEGYRELTSHAYVFVESSSAGGTHPALIEAMRLGNCVVVNDTHENLETIGDAGFSYNGAHGATALRQVLERLVAQPQLVEAYRRKARSRATAVYSWEPVVDEYERLFYHVRGLRVPDHLMEEVIVE